ncbi:cyclase family protein [Brenneria goodwinii]|uniref:cyclase family protein n=1 Tax=Brenneria goodwinii TaxID=1109412 RepID=UPI0036E68E44
MKQRIIDLSVKLQNGIPSDPPPFLPSIDYHNHAAGALQLAAIFPGLSPDDLPEKEGWAVEFVNMSTHAGTHMDAPWHYHSHMEDGGRYLTIDEIPLNWCIGPGVKLDFRQYPDGYVIGPADLDKEFARIGHRL